MEQPKLPDVHFGEVEEEETDELPEVENDEDDDEELSETSSDVVELLGFDPLEE